MKVVLAALFLTAGMAMGPGRGESVQVKGNPRFQQWADRSLMPSPSFRVFARDRECPFFEPVDGRITGCAQRFTVWVPLGYPASRWMFLHELGHVVHRQMFGGTGDPEVWAERFAQCASYGEHGKQVHSVPAGWCGRIGKRISERPARWWATTKGQVR